MIDMAQADRTLRKSNGGKGRSPFSWMAAIAQAAKTEVSQLRGPVSADPRN